MELKRILKHWLYTAQELESCVKFLIFLSFFYKLVFYFPLIQGLQLKVSASFVQTNKTQTVTWTQKETSYHTV